MALRSRVGGKRLGCELLQFCGSPKKKGAVKSPAKKGKKEKEGIVGIYVLEEKETERFHNGRKTRDI